MNIFFKRSKYKIILIFLFLNLGFVFSQQNFINVPSSEVTPKNKLFFQEQLNFDQNTESNTTIDYGLGKGFEVGGNLLGLNYNGKRSTFLNNTSDSRYPYNPLLVCNGLKQFVVSEKMDFTLGTQFGLDFTCKNTIKQATLVYLNYRVRDLFIPKSILIIGSYYNTLHYGGHGSRTGLWIGVEVPISETFKLVGESILGTNNLCYTSLGLVYYAKPFLPLTFGIQIPNNPGSGCTAVLEITIIPK